MDIVKSSYREISKGSSHNVLIMAVLIGVNALALFDILLSPSQLSNTLTISIGYGIAAYLIYLSFVRRVKEISMRKILGANNGHLYLMILIESLLYMLITSTISVVIIEQLTIFFIPLASISIEDLIKFISLVALATIIIGLYPFFKLISIKPVNKIRSKSSVIR